MKDIKELKELISLINETSEGLWDISTQETNANAQDDLKLASINLKNAANDLRRYCRLKESEPPIKVQYKVIKLGYAPVKTTCYAYPREGGSSCGVCRLAWDASEAPPERCRVEV